MAKRKKATKRKKPAKRKKARVAKKPTKRLVRTARKVLGPKASAAQVRKLASRVQSSLAARRAARSL